jgi:hypothetical protein|tara:strand:+ start:1330 stop:1659 length:330 start_codon:yes stop_codon:yes gene_type:complete
MKTQKKQKQLKLTVDQSKLLFNYNKANENKKAFTKLASDLKDPAVTIVDANGGQVFTTYKGHNVHAQTKHKEYFTIDLKKLQEDHPSIYNKYKTKEVHSITLEVNTVKI